MKTNILLIAFLLSLVACKDEETPTPQPQPVTPEYYVQVNPIEPDFVPAFEYKTDSIHKVSMRHSVHPTPKVRVLGFKDTIELKITGWEEKPCAMNIYLKDSLLATDTVWTSAETKTKILRWPL